MDVKYNNGQGRVIQKNVQLRNDTITDGITAVRHGNGRDWWVLARSWKTVPTNDITAYLISPSGVTANPTQYIGAIKANQGFYRLKFNLGGDHLYNVSSNGIIERYDFDRCTGILTNKQVYSLTSSGYSGLWGFEVSPDESKLYVTSIYQGVGGNTGYLIQFDLNSPNFIASAETLQTFINPDLPGLLELGPDGKIYLSTTWAGPDACNDYLYCASTINVTNTNLSVINSPDSAFPACDFTLFTFT